MYVCMYVCMYVYDLKRWLRGQFLVFPYITMASVIADRHTFLHSRSS